MRTVFISDLHLSRHQPRIAERFCRFGASLVGDIDALYILGDLFDYWIGDDGAQALGYGECVDFLGALTRRFPVRVMRGNRDFLLGRAFALRTGCELIDDPVVVNLYGHRVLIAHGDAYCTRDRAHQAWRALYSDPLWRARLLARPLATRQRTALALREQSEANKAAMASAIMDVTDAAVEAAMRAHAAQIMIHGHTHRPAVHRHRVDGGTATRIVLGDWHTHISYLSVSASGFHLMPQDVSFTPPRARSRNAPR